MGGTNLNVKVACKNCPFRRVGAIELHEGRLEGIASGLLGDDQEHFVCHKTLDSKAGRSMCAGAMVFLLKAGAQNVSMRLGAALGLLDFGELRKQFQDILDPEEVLGGKSIEQIQSEGRVRMHRRARSGRKRKIAGAAASR